MAHVAQQTRDSGDEHSRMPRQITTSQTLTQPSLSAKSLGLSSRWWGSLPILFFLLKCWQYRSGTDIYQIMWVCNITSLVLGLAIILRVRNLVFVASVLPAIGLPTWIFDFILNGDFHIFSVFTHVINPILGFFIARRLGWTNHAIWQTIAYFAGLQVMTRFITPAHLNINVAFEVYAPLCGLFPNFIVYSLANWLALLACTAAISQIFRGR